MLRQFVSEQKPSVLATYTRNPAILKMIRHVCTDIFPLSAHELLRSYAASLPHVTMINDITYHIDRYGSDGLFKGFDPADNVLDSSSLKNQFPILQSIRHALAITAFVDSEAKI